MNITKQELITNLEALLDLLRRNDKAETNIELSLSLAYHGGMQDLIEYIRDSEVIL